MMRVRDRHLVAVGAAACALCCAAPVLGLLGFATVGAVATVATFLFAGTAFALVVGVAALGGILMRRRARQSADVARATCAVPSPGPVPVDLTARPDAP